MMVSSKVPHHVGAVSIASYLAQRFTYLSAEEWQKRIAQGRIFRNGAVVPDIFASVTRGDSISYDLPDFQEPPANLDYRIVYEDAWLIGVDKPGNLLVHKSGRSFRSNLVYQLRYCHRPLPYPHVNAINRLDRETSGVVLFAKDLSFLRKMNDALSKRMIRKEYYAFVNGVPGERAWTVRLPIGKDEASSIHYKFRVDGAKGKDAETNIETVRILKGSTALLRVMPVTGRTHQIRVHLAACGFPIIGDKLYGMSEQDFIAWRNDPARFEGNGLFPRQALHCASIAFEHPETKKNVIIRAPLPFDMQQLLTDLGALPVPDR